MNVNLKLILRQFYKTQNEILCVPSPFSFVSSMAHAIEHKKVLALKHIINCTTFCGYKVNTFHRRICRRLGTRHLTIKTIRALLYSNIPTTYSVVSSVLCWHKNNENISIRL